jgi:hypothetical protein
MKKKKKQKWMIEFAGMRRVVSGKELKAAIRDSFKKKPPPFMSMLIKVTDKQTNVESWISSDAVTRLV